jgi:hypothetical protein
MYSRSSAATAAPPLPRVCPDIVLTEMVFPVFYVLKNGFVMVDIRSKDI